LRAVSKLHAGVALLFNNSLRDAVHFRMARTPRMYGMAARGRSILLTRAFHIPKKGKGGVGGTRHAARYLAMAMALGAPPWDGAEFAFHEIKEPESMSSDVLRAAGSAKLLAVAPGAAYGPSKRWPSGNFREVCRRWIKGGGDVAILGAPGEEEVAAEVADGLSAGNTFNLAGVTDLGDAIHVLKRASAVVANDSGIMHLSAVLGVPGVAVFGSTDPDATPPVSDKWRLLSAGLDCAPCFERTCRSGSYKCLELVTPDMVWSALSEIGRVEHDEGRN